MRKHRITFFVALARLKSARLASTRAALALFAMLVTAGLWLVLSQREVSSSRQTQASASIVNDRALASSNQSMHGQIPGRGNGGGGFEYQPFGGPMRGRRRPMPAREEFPMWEIESGFEDDVFTFVRIEFDSVGSFGWWSRWDNDYPDGDWNFSYRLQELTSLQVAPVSKVLRLTDPELFDYPFVYMAGAGKMVLSRSERDAFRRYLLNGGFVMIDDFWTPEQGNQVIRQMQAVLPDCRMRELTISHPIFHFIYDLKELPQVTDIQTWRDGMRFEHRHGYSGGDEEPHFWAFFDHDDRLVALLCHNNDIGDGWEREGENHDYFATFSERIAYPMGINIIMYAMTH